MWKTSVGFVRGEGCVFWSGGRLVADHFATRMCSQRRTWVDRFLELEKEGDERKRTVDGKRFLAKQTGGDVRVEVTVSKRSAKRLIQIP